MGKTALQLLARAPLALLLSAVLGTSFIEAAGLSVTSCTDDLNDVNSLRNIIKNAPTGSTIDFNGLPVCVNSTITLTHGEILIPQPNLSIQGPQNATLEIDGDNFRVFNHSPTTPGTLGIANLIIANGYYYDPSHVINKGGCITSSYNVALDHTTVTGCSVQALYGSSVAKGGAIYAQGSVSLLDSKVSNNSALGTTTAYGGGVYSKNTIFLDHSIVSGNSANAYSSSSVARGGALFGGFEIITSKSTITTNKALAPGIGSAGGGGFVLNGFVQSYYSTIDNNSASTGGGLVVNGGTVIQDCTIVDNTAAQGSALYVTGGQLSMANSTVSANTSTNIGGSGFAVAAKSGASVVINSSIIAANKIGSDLYVSLGASVSGSANLVMSTNVLAPPAGFIAVNADPQLGPFAFNGGVTRTVSLTPGSPAIGKGNNLPGSRPNDQRGIGYPRTSGSLTDIGAFEFDSIFSDGFDALN